MATVGLYGSSSSGVVAAASGSESIGLYGNGTSFGGSYFEWFIFQVADTQPATPTGGSWDFNTNTGTPPTGWSSTPPANPTNIVWVSIALVNSKNVDNLVWSAPGKFSYSSGLPILSGSGTPGSGDGQSDQLYIQLDTTPQTIWFKESGTWTRLTGSTLYVDTTSNQTIAGTKTFSSQIQGSISGTASNVTGIVGIANGGTGSTTATGARTALGAAASGANSDITSLSGLTTALSIAQGGTGATTANGALSNLGGIGTITSTDGSITVTPAGTTVNLAVSEASPASTVLTPVRNTTGATLTKGTVVYISGATGQIATVSKALASSDATSAQTLGMITSDLPNNTNGYVTVFGLILDIDTSAYADGAQLYLSGTTAGAVTATKPSAPTHLVYVAVVEYSHAVHGKLLVKVQNGYELDELHNVSITSPATGQTIIYDSGTSLWSNSTVSLTAGVNGTLPIANGGTGQTTANAAFNALAPSQTGNSGKYLTTDGTNTSWATNPLGTVTSVGGTGTVSGITLSGTVTTSGNLTLGGALDLSAYNGAGAFTTLSASGAVTLSGGTANGVAYLNGSKVVTTGSALTFDGTKQTITSYTPAAPVELLRLSNSGAGDLTQAQITFYAASSNYAVITGGYNGAPSLISNVAAGGYQSWQIATNEQMRLTSTGLGIGTSSPAAKLHVLGNIRQQNVTDGSDTFKFLNAAGGTLADLYGFGTSYFTIQSGSNIPLIYNSQGASGVHRWQVNSSDVMRLDSSGNLGIGTSSPGAKVDVRGASTDIGFRYIETSTGNTNRVELGAIAGLGYINATAGVGQPGLALQVNGSTKATLDSSGNLGLGVTPSAWNADYKNFAIGTGGEFYGRVSTTEVGYGSNYYRNSGGSYIYLTSAAASYQAQVGGVHYWFTAPSGTAGNAISFTQAMTLDASGNLALGTTAPNNGGNNGRWLTLSAVSGSTYSGGLSFAIGGTNQCWLYQDTDNLLAFQGAGSNAGFKWMYGGTERARIDSSGNFLLGTTSSSYSNSTSNIFGPGAIYIQHVNGTGSGNNYAAFAYNGAAIGSITQSGTTAVLYNVTSDQRLKENIVDAPEFGSVIDSIKVRSYDWKADGNHQRAGFIAQELVTVAPEAVHQPADPEQMMAVDYSKLVPMLVKEIQSLRARVAQLEGN